MVAIILMFTLTLMLLTALLTAAFFIAAKHRRIPNLKFNPDELPEIQQCLHVLAGLTSSVVRTGNKVDILQNGFLFPAMIKDIRTAQGTVHLETFVWAKGSLEKKFVALFCAKARQGVKVRILIDAVGGRKADPLELEKLRNAGVELRLYCRPRWWNLRRFNHRTHRKLLIIDGKTSFIFGHGIADQWLGNGQDSEHWRDTGARIAGPSVQSLQSVFVENWIEEAKVIPTEASCFPPLQHQGRVIGHVVSSATGEALSSVALLYTLAIACARKEVLIQNPYFAPEKSVAELLGKMVKRGVKVKLMLPGEKTDNPFVRRAGQFLYLSMLRAGVRIYEFKPTLLHQKVVVIDRVWTHVGSTNFDARSLAINEEVGIGLLDATIARKMRASFANDLQHCREIFLNDWLKRRWYSRLLDWFAFSLRNQI